MRNTDERKWDDRVFRQWGPEGKLVFLYMCDNCDCGGFLDYDPELWAFRMGAEIEWVDSGFRVVEGSGKGLVRVKQGLSKGNERVVWLPNYVKVQLKGNSLKLTSNYCRGIYTRLDSMKLVFPEVDVYLRVAQGLFNPTSTPHEEKRREGKGFKIGGEECRGEPMAEVLERVPVEGEEDPLYRKLVEVGLHRTCRYVNFRMIVREHPDIDWEKAVNHVVATHQNSADGFGVRNSYTMLMALARKTTFQAPGAGKRDPNAGNKGRDAVLREKIEAVEKRWRDGEIDADECEKLVAEAKREY